MGYHYIFAGVVSLATKSFPYRYTVVAITDTFTAVIDPGMHKFGDISSILSGMSVSTNNAGRPYFLPNYKHDRFAPDVGNRHGVDFAATFEKAKHDHLASSTSTSFSFAMTTTITFIHFNFTTKPCRPIVLFASNRTA